MPILTDVQKNNLAASYGTNATHGLLGSNAGLPAGGASQAATNELAATGTPAYARKALAWTAGAAGVRTATGVFDVASGVTVGYAGTASSIVVAAATLLDAVAVTAQPFSSQGTYTVSYTYTQT